MQSRGKKLDGSILTQYCHHIEALILCIQIAFSLFNECIVTFFQTTAVPDQ